MIETTRACSCGTKPTTRMGQLVVTAEEAAQVRALTTRPDVVALRVDHVRAQVDALLWSGIVLGLLFTMVNVHQFAAAGAKVFSAAWCTAWLLDPMVSLVLLAVLRAEQVTARYQVALGVWPRRTKWCAFVATYVMNTWSSWGLDGAPRSAHELTAHVHESGAHRSVVHEPVVPERQTSGPASNPDAAARHQRRRRPRQRAPVPRRLLVDYLAGARAALAEAAAAGQHPEPTPAWCRQVTGCSAGTSVKLAAALRTSNQPADADTDSDADQHRDASTPQP